MIFQPLNSTCNMVARRHTTALQNEVITGLTLTKTTYKEIEQDELDALIARVTEAKEHGLALSPDDCQLLIDALVSLASLQTQLADNDVTLNKLLKLAGIVRSSEKLGNQLSKNKSQGKKKNRGKGNKSDNTTKPEVKNHQLEHLSKGQQCPECDKGKLYKYEPATFLRITGHSPFSPEQHVLERLRCNACGAYFTANLPEDVLKDGKSNQKYGFSARSIMAVAKFYMGSPYYRQGSLQDMLGVPVTASTIFDQSELVSNAVQPVFRYLCNEIAANAWHYYIDDTSNRINKQGPIIKPSRSTGKDKVRTGIYTSGLIATTNDNQRLVLYQTGIGHAGEFIDEILRKRSSAASVPIVMSDALSSNRPSVLDALISLCNSHGRRQFFDVHNHFPQEVEYVIALYDKIWDFEREVVEGEMTSQQRLEYHKKHSLPVMDVIKAWGNDKLESDEVEENSGLGKAIRYFDKHYYGLTSFCRVEGAKLDNNLMEAQLKLIARNRKNAGPFQTENGAGIADVITSMIATAAQAGINPVNYFTYLQRNADKVKENPENYLPWDFKENG